MMNDTTQATAAVLGWLAALEGATSGGSTAPATLLHATLPQPSLLAPALAALAAEALARDRSLLVVTPGDDLLPEISNALDLGLRPLCLVLPGADYASRIALRATLSLLKSRLSRDGDDTQGPAWRAQRARLAEHAGLWHDCLAWCARSGDRESWPPAITPVFPARFAPRTVAASLLAGHGKPDEAKIANDWVVIVGAEACGESAHWSGARATLLLHGAATGPTAIVPMDERARLSVEFELLGQELAELELELATAQAELAAFTDRYHRVVGNRMAELDALQADVALRRARSEPASATRRQAAAAAAAQAARSDEESRRYANECGGEGKARNERHSEANEAANEFRPGTDVKKLYRQIAQKIHPDRARDEADRAWRTELMTEANRAYRGGDREALQEILASWQESMPGAPHTGKESGAARDARGTLARRVMRLRRRIAEIEAELNQIYGSRLYELFAAAKIARRQGRDLMQEMAERLDAQIADIRAALAASGESA